jgi:SAM-dependent methyltransferase
MICSETAEMDGSLPEPECLWNGEVGAGGISWADRSQMGPLRGVIDAADLVGRRNAYMHTLHTIVLERELKRIARARRTLDFGCGTGRFFEPLARHSDELFAVDREPAMVQAASHYGGRFAARIDCWRTDDLPYEEGFFDFVLCASVLCVTTRSLFDRSIREIARVCRHGGRTLLMEQVRGDRGLTLERYANCLSESGFRVVRAYPIRASTSSTTRLVTCDERIPQRFFRILASLELAITRSRSVSDEAAYCEFAFLAIRER